MNHFRARRAVRILEAFRHDALLYWALFPNDTSTIAYEITVISSEIQAMKPPPGASELQALRARVNQTTPVVAGYADELGIARVQSVKLPQVAGGGTIGVDLLQNLTDQNPRNWLQSPPGSVLEFIDRCIGAAKEARRRGLLRLVVPLYWLVDIPALAVRWPWLILEAAGLPREYERTLVSNVLKVLLFIGYVLVATVLVGGRISPDLLRALVPK